MFKITLALATQACFIVCVCVFCIKDAPRVVPEREIFNWATLSVGEIVASMVDEWNMSMESWCKHTDRGQNHSEKNLSATLSTTNPTWTGLTLIPCLRDERPATFRLSYGTAKLVSCISYTPYVTNCWVILTNEVAERLLKRSWRIWGAFIFIMVY